MAMAEFGAAIKASDFYFDDSHVHLNHGSYGAVPRPVQQERIRLMGELERSPDVWYRWTSPRLWKQNRQAAADFVGSHVDNIVLVTNATAACNAVIKSLKYAPGESILVNNYTYKAVVNCTRAAMEQSGGEVLSVTIPLELDHDTLIAAYKETLERNPTIKLVVLDLIASCSALRYPIKDLIDLCKEHDKLVLVDGAHGPGQVQLHLDTLGAHFFTGNFHKWLYAPRGCSILWVHPDFNGVIQPIMTSHDYKADTLQKNFFWPGTFDNTSFFCAERAIQYYRDVGGMDKITTYCSDVLDQAVDMLTAAWGTAKFPITRDMEAPCMRLVELPALPTPPDNPVEEFQYYDMPWLIKALTQKYDITAVCACIHGRNWVRLSANIYNSMHDYDRLRDAVLDTVKQ